MHQIQVNIVHIQRLQRRVDAILDAVVPGIVELGCDPDLAAGDSGVFDALPNLMFVTIGKSSVPWRSVWLCTKDRVVSTHVSM
jgi:hypothetical protein